MNLHIFFINSLLYLNMYAHAALPVRILTHNIRYATTSPSANEKPWSTRKQLILNELHHATLYNPESFVCLQEVLSSQLSDILAGLGTSEWAYIGVGRDDGKAAGEFSPILYRRGVWNVDSWETRWLNEDGSVGKKGWDAGSVRIVTVGNFTHAASKKKIHALCTHFDNAGAVSRRESAKIVLGMLTNATDVPFFLAGDLNSQASGEAYKLLNAETSPLRDIKEMAKWNYGNQNSWTDFTEDLSLLDFVFVGPRGGSQWTADGYSILANRFDDGVYNSDHRAVVADMLLII